MSFSNRINPPSDLKEFWKLVLKRIHMEIDNHRAPAMYASVSAIIGILYVLTIVAISGDIYLAVNILKKQGVKPEYVAIQICADIVLAILPFILLKSIPYFAFLDKVTNKNRLMFYELDSRLKIKDETKEQEEVRKENNRETLIPPIISRLLWSNIFTFSTYIAIFSIAYWKIYTYQSNIPYSIFITPSGKMVVTLSIIVAIFHIIATERTLIHFLYWRAKRNAIKKFNQYYNPNDEPIITTAEIVYLGEFKNAKSGYTEIQKLVDGKVVLQYAYIIRDEEILALTDNNNDKSAKMAIIAACKNIQLNH